MKNKSWLWLGLIILLAAILRLYNPLFRSLWGDEAHSFFAAQLLISNPLEGIRYILISSHLPLYFVMLAAWLKCFGVGEYFLRLFSILIGIVCVPSMYFFSKKVFDDKTAILASLLLALSPLALMHSQEVRVYGLALLFAIISLWLFWIILSGKASKTIYLSYAFFSVLLALTHVFGILLIVTQFLCVWMARGEKKEKKYLIVCQAVVLLFVLPFYFSILSNSGAAFLSGKADMAFSAFPFYLKPFLFIFVLLLAETMAPWNILALPALIALVFLGFHLLKKLDDNNVFILIFLCFFPILLASIFSPSMPKYLIICLPSFLLLLSRSILELKSQSVMAFCTIAIVIFMLVSDYNYFALREYHNSNQIEPWRIIANNLTKKYEAGDLIIGTNYFIVNRLLDYYINFEGQHNLAVYSLQKSAYQSDCNFMLYSGNNRRISLCQLNHPRIWLVGHIADDRAFSLGYVDKIIQIIEKKYKLVEEKDYIPYNDTLVSMLPIQRHVKGGFRVTVRLYKKML